MYTPYLNNGDEISFTVRSIANETFKAKIQRMSGALDTRLRSERVEMDVINNNKKLLPGMVAEVILALNSHDSTFVVPKTAVVTTSERAYVITVKNNVTHGVSIKKGRESGDNIEIFSDSLSLNDKLVKAANEEIRNGTAVK